MSSRITEMQLLTLAFNYVRAVRDKSIGVLDIPERNTIEQLSNIVEIPDALLESLLAYSNFLDEEGKFACPGLPFDKFLTGVLNEKNFNKIFNTIEEK